MRLTFFILLILTLIGCNQHKEYNVLQNRNDSLENKINQCKNTEYLSQSLLWFQHAPELQALYIQSFNVAKKALTYNLKHKTDYKKKNAVVVDIDETILNNSLYQGWLYFSNSAFTDSSWNSWVMDTLAEPLPGAIDFLIFAEKKGCEIFYVSNRKHDLHFAPTLQNLRKYNLPFADEKHLLLKTKSDTTLKGLITKEKRRLKIENDYNYEILLLCGDQLTDFDLAFDVFNAATEEHIKDSIFKYKEEFGNKFIILPNPMYSDWLNKIIVGENKNTFFVHLDSLRFNKILHWKY